MYIVYTVYIFENIENEKFKQIERILLDFEDGILSGYSGLVTNLRGSFDDRGAVNTGNSGNVETYAFNYLCSKILPVLSK